MARAAQEALLKIENVLPDGLRQRIENLEIHAFAPAMSDITRKWLDEVESAVDDRRRITLEYSNAQSVQSERIVRPLGLWFWGKVWTLVAWCELRDDFRVFRLDRITAIRREPGDRFVMEEGKSLEDFYRLMESREPADDTATRS